MRFTPFLASMLLCISAAPNDANPIEHGRAVFRSNCAFCHGLRGEGGRGPTLAGTQSSDEQIKRVIRDGVPGSTMPAFSGFDTDDLNHLIVFIRQLSPANNGTEKVSGDPHVGRSVYERNGCARCHRIGAEGSTFGPDLTRVGGARSVKYLRDSLVDPSVDVPENYEGVSVTTTDGKRITGVRINEDTFSVQLRLPNQQFRSFLKDEVKEVKAETKSLMPAYKNMPPEQLNNLIAYLLTLRGATVKGAEAKEAGGIR